MKLAFVSLLLLPALLPAARTLDIYFVDVEGGAATLVVTPQKESLLMDAGWPREDSRDAKRIVEVATKQAGLKRIDYFVTSHFHTDHVGGVPGLAALIPIGKFVDHGDVVGKVSPAGAAQWEAYLKVSQGKRWSVKPGDKIPFKRVAVEVVASDGRVLAKPLGPQSANPLCADATLKKPDPGEDARSVAFLVSMGKFRFFDPGDVSWNVEHELACPQNLLGGVDVYQVAMHGMPMSGAPQHVWAIKPTVDILNNGHRKGGAPAAYEMLRKSPGLEDLWQLHYAVASDKEHNTDERMIANLTEEKDCAGHWLKVSAASNGKYTVTNSRNGFSKTYTAK